jgi:hypothetical protein
MSAENRIWEYLITHNRQATNYEIANFMRGSEGQLSTTQRLRDIRKELQAIGKDLSCTIIRTGVYLYKIEDHITQDSQLIGV